MTKYFDFSFSHFVKEAARCIGGYKYLSLRRLLAVRGSSLQILTKIDDLGRLSLSCVVHPALNYQQQDKQEEVNNINSRFEKYGKDLTCYRSALNKWWLG